MPDMAMHGWSWCQWCRVPWSPGIIILSLPWSVSVADGVTDGPPFLFQLYNLIIFSAVSSSSASLFSLGIHYVKWEIIIKEYNLMNNKMKADCAPCVIYNYYLRRYNYSNYTSIHNYNYNKWVIIFILIYLVTSHLIFVLHCFHVVVRCVPHSPPFFHNLHIQKLFPHNWLVFCCRARSHCLFPR